MGSTIHALLLLVSCIISIVVARCPTSWQEYRGNCYFFSDQHWNWDQSRSLCQSREADLASIASVQERDYLQALVLKHGLNYWIGGTSLPDPAKKVWRWVDRTKWNPKLAIWGPGQPANIGKENCLEWRGADGRPVWKEGKWNNLACNNGGNRYICKRRNDVADMCNLDEGWHPFNDKCYIFRQEMESWQGARERCQEDDGDLISVNTLDKVNILRDMTHCGDRKTALWIGLSDAESPGAFASWVDGSTYDARTSRWQTGQPVWKKSGENCVEALSWRDYRWMIDSCGDEKKFLCEKPQGECAPGWREAYGLCYQLNKEAPLRMSWIDAVDFCRQQGASILKIESGREQGWIRGILKEFVAVKASEIWLGVSDRDSDGVFTWFDSSPVVYKQWDRRQPTNVKGAWDCGVISTGDKNGKWKTRYCFVEKAFICKVPIIQDVVTPTPPPPQMWYCESKEWELFQQKCYRFYTVQKEWSQARQQCLANSGDLVSITSGEEQSFVSGQHDSLAWYGLNDLKTGGNLEWSDGSKVTFLNWGPTRGLAKDRCIRGGYTTDSGMWKRVVCSTKYKFVCKKDAIHRLSPPTTTLPPTTVPFNPICGPGWVFDPISNFCYRINSELRNWVQHRNRCRRLGGDLLSIHGLHESSFVTAYVLSKWAEVKEIWNGANARDLQAGWQWSDSSPFNYFNWEAGQPDDNFKNCVYTTPFTEGKWRDAQCNLKYAAMCKKYPKGIVTTPAPTQAPEPCKPQAMISGRYYIADSQLTASQWIEGNEPWKSRIDSRQHDETTCSLFTLYKGYVESSDGKKTLPKIASSGECQRRCAIEAGFLCVAATFEAQSKTCKLYPYFFSSDRKPAPDTEKFDHYARLCRKRFGPYNVMSNNYANYQWGTNKNNESFIIKNGRQRFWVWFPGRTGQKNTVSFEDSDRPNYYLRHLSSKLYTEHVDFARNPHLFDKDATFSVSFDKLKGFVQFEAVNAKGQFIRHNNMALRIDKGDGSDNFKQDSSWRLKAGPYFIMSRTSPDMGIDFNNKQEGILSKNPKQFYRYFPSLSGEGDRTSFESVDRPKWYLRRFKADDSTHNIDLDSRDTPKGNGGAFDEEASFHQNLDVFFRGYMYYSEFEYSDSDWKKNFYLVQAKNRLILQKYDGSNVNKFQSDASFLIVGESASKSWQVNEAGHWIEADFGAPIAVTGLVTQGDEVSARWVTKYILRYQYDHDAPWRNYEDPPGITKTFAGNQDQNGKRVYNLTTPFTAQYVRLMPTQFKTRIALRWEIIGCRRRSEECGGRENVVSGVRLVPNSAMTASSSLSGDYGPAMGRMVFNNTPGWVAKDEDGEQWLQVDLLRPFRITSIKTQGRRDEAQWVTSYRLLHSMDGEDFRTHQDPFGWGRIFNANRDQRTVVQRWLTSRVVARYVRIQPQSFYGAIAMRLEITACIPGCDPIPMISGRVSRVPNNRLSARTSRPGMAPHRSRLGALANGNWKGAWGPKFDNIWQWIEVDLGVAILVRAISTRGRQDLEEWTTSYKVRYRVSEATWWREYKENGTAILEGNFDQDRIRKHYLGSPFVARYVRLLPQTWYNHIALRWEVFGCPGPVSAEYIGCYKDAQDRDLPYVLLKRPPGGMSPLVCTRHCFHNDYQYAGLQNSDECWCGNSYGKYGPTPECNMKCSGEPASVLKCGGRFANSIYSTGLSPSTERCPALYDSYGDKCYRYIAKKLNWNDAVTNCRKEGGDLATIHSEAEMGFVTSLIGKYAKENVWIGLNDLRNVRLFEWSSGADVSYTNWQRGQPDNVKGRKQNCVYVEQKKGQWHDFVCNSKRGSICKMAKQIVPPGPTPPNNVGCPEGFLAYRWACYSFLQTGRTWEDGRKACRALGGYQVRVDDRFEQSWLSSQLAQLEGQYWSDVKKNGSQYVWSDGNSDIPITHWDEGFPDSSKGDCVFLTSGERAGLWRNLACGQKRKSVCKRMRGGRSTPLPTTTVTAISACAPGWLQWRQFCFEVNSRIANMRMSWQDALKDCRAKGADLASFHTQDQHDFIWRSSVVGDSDGNFWIGLNSINMKEGHQWSDNSPLQFTNWAPGEPNNMGGTENCVEMITSSSQWNDHSCWMKRNWICKIQRGKEVNPLSTTLAPSPGPAGSCKPDSDDWKFYKGRCFYFSNGTGEERLTWRRAENWCNDNGGNLASIPNADVQNFLKGQVVEIHDQIKMWIGLNEIDEGGYKWSDGTSAKYFAWAPGEPNDNGGVEQCVEMINNGGLWNDNVCSKSLGFICSKPPGGTTPAPGLTPTPMPGNCPVGSSAYGDKCFVLIYGDSDKKSWQDAESACSDMGVRYHLASISSQEEQDFLTSQLASKEKRHSYWIGLRQQGRGYYWIDNTDVTYTNWALGEPNNDKENCVQMLSRPSQSAGKWNDVYCTIEHRYICMTYKQSSLSSPAPTVRGPCPEGWISSGSNCYLHVTEGRGWKDADTFCGGKKADLVSILSAFEQAFLNTVIRQKGITSPMWTGMTDFERPGTFSWSDGWPVTYVRWAKGQPTKEGGCVQMNSAGYWEDTPDCEKNMQFFCKTTTDRPVYTNPPSQMQCPDDEHPWVAFGMYCYLFFPEAKLSLAEADLECQQLDSGLLSLHSPDVNSWVTTHMVAPVWLGLIKQRSGGFRWKDGSPVDYTNWAPGEPSDKDGKAGENCVELYLQSDWNDIVCDVKRGYICQVKQVFGSTQSSAKVITDFPTLSTPIKTPETVPPDNTSPPSRTTPRRTISPWSTWSGWSSSTRPPVIRTSTSPPQTPPPTGSQQVANKPLGGGAIAAIVIAVLTILVLVIIIAVYVTMKRGSSSPFREMLSFENALYKEGTVEVQPSVPPGFPTEIIGKESDA